MANSDGANTEFRSFAQLPERHQRAIILKSQGKTYETIAETLQLEFKVPCSRNTVNQWFAAGGLLEAANYEYTDQLAEHSLRSARQAAKRGSEAAIMTMIELMSDRHDDATRLQAAWRLANKYIPDRQIINPGNPLEMELPPELIAAGERIINERNHQ